MNVLVVGGAGYIGTTLIPMLLAEGHRVILFDNFMYGIQPTMSFIQDVIVEKGDVRDSDALHGRIRQADCIIHLAAIVGYPACSRDKYLARTVNVEGTKAVARSISSHQMFLFASTGSTYGMVEGICTEDTPINPLTLYGETKAESEQIALDAGAVALRFATVFGVSPRMRLDLLVNDFCWRAYHEKVLVLYEEHHRRTFMHVSDAAKSYLFAMDNYERMKGEAFNVGSDKMNFTKLELAEAIQRQKKYKLYKEAIGEDLDKRDYSVSYKRLNDLGYDCSEDLDGGINELLRVVPYIDVAMEWRNA